jgi:hypothetical protein
MPEYNPAIDPALLTRPIRGHDEIVFCRAMQRWAAREVDPRNNQRVICIADWFSEELLIANERTTRPSLPPQPEFKHGEKSNDRKLPLL